MSSYVTLEDDEDLISLTKDDILYDLEGPSEDEVLPEENSFLSRVGRFGTASLDFIKKTGTKVKDVVVETSKNAKIKVDSMRSNPPSSPTSSPKNPIGVHSSTSTTEIASPKPVNMNPFKQNIQPVFGVTWDECLKNDRHIMHSVPTVISSCLSELFERGIYEEGIFRISGSLLQMQELKRQINEGKKPNLDEQSIHNVAGLFKMFFRELKDHMFGDAIGSIEKSMKNPNEKSVTFIREQLRYIPASKVKTLSLVFDLLVKIAEHSKVNLMNASNLSIIFTQVLQISSLLFKFLIEHPEVFS